MARLSLEGMEFHAPIGHFEEEKLIGNKYLLDVAFDIDERTAANTDNLDETVDYQQVYDIVKKEMSQPCDLIERAASQVADALKKHFPDIRQLEVKLSKLNPPIHGVMDKVSVVIRD